jgi:hypothetical protein
VSHWHLCAPTAIVLSALYLMLLFRQRQAERKQRMSDALSAGMAHRVRVVERSTAALGREVRGLVPALNRLTEVLERAGSRGVVSLLVGALDREAEAWAREQEASGRG